MKTISKMMAGLILSVAAATAQQASAAPQFGQCASLPGTSNAVSGGCNVLITNSSSGLVIAVDGNAAGFGGEDSFVGVVNSASTPLFGFSLSSSLDIFGFDGDGTLPNGEYAPAGITFTGISADLTSGTVNFSGGLAPGAVTAFELEENLSTSGIAPPVVGTTATPGSGPVVGPTATTVSEPASITLLGLALAGLVNARRKAS